MFITMCCQKLFDAEQPCASHSFRRLAVPFPSWNSMSPSIEIAGMLPLLQHAAAKHHTVAVAAASTAPVTAKNRHATAAALQRGTHLHARWYVSRTSTSVHCNPSHSRPAQRDPEGARLCTGCSRGPAGQAARRPGRHGRHAWEARAC